MAPRTKIPATLWRRISQLVFLALFLVLFIRTDYTGSEELSSAVNILFRIDPFLALAAMLAGKLVIALMLPALATVLFTLVFGRFFCGWVCPLGTLIDGCHRIGRGRHHGFAAPAKRLKYGLLLFLLTASLFGLPLAGYLDPFSLLVRGLTLSVYPALDDGTVRFFTLTYNHAPAWFNAVSEPVYDMLKEYVLPFAPKVYGLSLFSLFLLLAVFAAEFYRRRFFCNEICPLGGLLAAVSRFSLFSGRGGDNCGRCTRCREVCRMGAIGDKGVIRSEDCTLCLDCLVGCPAGRITFSFARPSPKRSGVPLLSRRAFVGGLASGAVLPLFLSARSLARRPDPLLIRPPGALPEDEFLGRCLRCGECMKVCIGNALQPAFLEGGVEGMFSPLVRSRIGYCEYQCTLCGQVCPSGAIAELTPAEKKKTVIGRALFDKNRCLPYAKGVPCIVCEEHCPVPDKAIKFRPATVVNGRGEEVRVKQPYLVDELCIGCGICENKCPLPGEAAVRVTSEGESRHATMFTESGYF